MAQWARMELLKNGNCDPVLVRKLVVGVNPFEHLAQALTIGVEHSGMLTGAVLIES